MPVIKRKIKPDSFVYTDSYRSYNTLDVSEFKHFRVNHSKEFTCGKNNHINGTPNFWNQSKRTLRKHNGIDKKHFHLFLKGCEFRLQLSPKLTQLKCRISYRVPIRSFDMSKRITETQIVSILKEAEDNSALMSYTSKRALML